MDDNVCIVEYTTEIVYLIFNFFDWFVQDFQSFHIKNQGIKTNRETLPFVSISPKPVLHRISLRYDSCQLHLYLIPHHFLY